MADMSTKSRQAEDPIVLTASVKSNNNRTKYSLYNVST